MNLSTRIVWSRKGKKFSQQAVANILGVSRSALAQWETAVSRPSLDNMRKMAKALDVSFEWLATGRGNRHVIATDDVVKDTDIDQEIINQIQQMNLVKKRAVLNIIKAIF